jgi:glutamate--cysteine ligase
LNTLLSRRLALLSEPAHAPLLSKGLRGIERETLRIDARGDLALTPHPAALGSALTNPQITTDYSESLLEFVTPARDDIATALQDLDAVHRFASAELGDEMLWSESMPCRLPEEESIPIAWYGTSNIGMAKHVYRRGLALRYGRAMQCIAGIHYNFSLSSDVWRLLQDSEVTATAGGAAGLQSLRDYQSEGYIAMVRNFNRYSWLLMYLFGASPALNSHFLRNDAHGLETLSDDTLYLPHATSLRMSDLGYSNNAQAGLMLPYNTLQQYMRSMSNAVAQPYPPYEALGTRRDGEWVQINTNVLQIENEFYATIRPKRVINSGERPLEALCARGVQYVEVRCMDVDPFEPLGISLETARFLDAFLHFCALEQSASTNQTEGRENTGNFALVVKEGRKPGLMLQSGGAPVSLHDWGVDLLDRIAPVAAMLDAQRGERVHADALAVQRASIEDPSLTPSARVLAALSAHGDSFPAFGLAKSREHTAGFLARPLTAAQRGVFEVMARDSVLEQARMEREESNDFDSFITDYGTRTPNIVCE